MNRYALRQAALRWRTQELGIDSDELMPVAGLLARCAEITGIAPSPLPSGDPLLCGAAALLDRDAQAIWYDASLLPNALPSILAHEYAHIALHSPCAPQEFGEITSDEFYEAPEQSRAGYSPQQRREVDANVWAAELLLPTSALRHAFFKIGLGANEIAAHVGLSLSIVQAQMRFALLCPEPYSATTVPQNDSASEHKSRLALDPSQQAAVTVRNGPYLLSAGPGTGKTRTLIARCAHLARERGAPPESILILTFSRKAAAELSERLIVIGIGTEASGPWVGTYHAFSLELLRRFGSAIGLNPGWKLIGEREATALMERRLAYLQQTIADSPPLTLPLGVIMQAISRAKNELCGSQRYAALVESHCAAHADSNPKQTRHLREIARVYALYEDTLKAARRLDYGDLLMTAVRILDTSEPVRSRIAEEFPWILTDEYQDVNFACAELLRLLSGPKATGLWVVGDRRQSIYRFRGASPAGIAQFAQNYPSAQMGELSTNYRSAPPITQLVSGLAARLSAAEAERFMGWSSARPTSDNDASRVTLAVADDYRSQAAGMAERMRAMESAGTPFRGQAVLCRTNAQAAEIARALESRGIPVSSPAAWLEIDEVKDLACLLALFTPDDQGAASILRLSRLFGVTSNLIALLGRIKAQPASSGTLAERLLSDQEFAGCDKEVAAVLRRVGGCNSPLALLGRFLFTEGSYLRKLYAGMRDDPNRLGRALLGIRRLVDLAEDWQRTNRQGLQLSEESTAGEWDSISRFLRDLRNRPAEAEADQLSEADAVHVMTVHAAKGLEFTAVFVPNLSKGQFPVLNRSGAVTEPDGLNNDPGAEAAYDEEACLFFVALSRAKDYLILSYAERHKAGERLLEPSPLLKLISDGLREVGVKPTRWSSQLPSYVPEYESNRSKPIPQLAQQPRFTEDALDLYRACPRQYYYRFSQGLTGANEEIGYDRMLEDAAKWLREELAAGRAPERDVIESKLDSIWKEAGAVASLQQQAGRDQALRVLLQQRDSYKGLSPDLVSKEFTCEIELENCVVTGVYGLSSSGVKCAMKKNEDRGERAPRESVEATRRSKSFISSVIQWFKEDPNAANSSNADSGEEMLIQPGRARQLERAADGILRGEFPAAPDHPGRCRSCPFYFACPE